MSYLIWLHDPAPTLEIEETWYGFRYAGLRNTKAGHRHARITDFIMPYLTYIATIPFGGTNCLLMVPIDDDNHWRYSVLMKPMFETAQRIGPPQTGILPRDKNASNDYMLDRELQRTTNYSGITGGAVVQDQAVTESMGLVYDRTLEHLGTSDKAIIHMRRLLIAQARALEAGHEPLGTDGTRNFRSIRSAEKILAADEDWRLLGTDRDPMVERLEVKLPAR